MMRNVGPKVLALLLAGVIWVFASNERREEILERNFTIPVALVGVPANMVISSEVEDTIAVRLRGPASQVRELRGENMEVTVDLKDSRSGTVNIPIAPSSIDIPRNVEVVSMQPARISLQLEQRKQDVVSIRPYLVGSPAAGFVIENIEVRPARALIIGPTSLVEEVTEIPTERIILTGRNMSFRETVSVISDYPLVRVVEPASVDVLVTISAQNPPIPQPVDEDSDSR